MTCAYQRRGERAAATGVQVARLISGQINWASPLDTISLPSSSFGGIHRVSKQIAPTFTDGETVRLAVRAVTAAGEAGDVMMLDPVVADAAAPGDVDYLEVRQV